MKKLLLIILTIITVSATSQTVYIHNFCYNKQANVRASYYTIQDSITSTAFFTEEEMGQDYINIKNMLVTKFGVPFDSIADFMYQNINQTAWLKKERFIMRDIDDNFYDKLINEQNFTEQELMQIYLFGEKLKTLILK